VKVEEGRYLADHIPGARWAELPGDDHPIWAGDTDRALDEIEEFMTGIRPRPLTERVLLTVLFTDIVGSTSRVAELGDRRWQELLRDHDEAIRAALSRYEGSEVKTTGDGFLATFQHPSKGIRCACAIRDRAGEMGLEIRASLHTGECERRAHDLSGIAVNIAARILDEASAGDIVVSATVKDLVVGSGIAFDARGKVTLRGVPGRWSTYAVVPGPKSE
jgi:class 3 adenylate cyclase